MGHTLIYYGLAPLKTKTLIVTKQKQPSGTWMPPTVMSAPSMLIAAKQGGAFSPLYDHVKVVGRGEAILRHEELPLTQ